MVMMVRIADLKTHLSAHLRAVRRGQTVTVLDRDTPIARIVPYGQTATVRLTVRKPGKNARPLGLISVPPPLMTKVDVLELLREERRDRL